MNYNSVFKKLDEDKLKNDVYELTCKFNALCDYLGVKAHHINGYQVFKEKDGKAD